MAYPPKFGGAQSTRGAGLLLYKQVLLSGILKGVQAPMHQAPLPKSPRHTPTDHYHETMATLQDYLRSNVIRPLTQAEIERTRYWVPAFPRPKKDSPKIRLITDLRDLNSCHQVPRHRAETWKTLLTTLQDQTLTWGITLDLQNFFHHLQVHPRIQRWMRICIHSQHYQLLGMPFGWAMSPWWSNKLTKPIRSWLNNRQWAHSWYVDDILVLGKTQQETEQRAAALVQLLTDLGIRVNQAKSMSCAAQTFTYLGHSFHLADNLIKPLNSKLQGTVQMIRHQLKGTRFQPKHIAALAGNLLDSVKSNVALQGLPQQLMKHAALGVAANKRLLQTWTKYKWWATATVKPLALTQLLKLCLHYTLVPTPRVLRGGDRHTS